MSEGLRGLRVALAVWTVGAVPVGRMFGVVLGNAEHQGMTVFALYEQQQPDARHVSQIPGFLNPVSAGAAWRRALRCSTPRCWSRPAASCHGVSCDGELSTRPFDAQHSIPIHPCNRVPKASHWMHNMRPASARLARGGGRKLLYCLSGHAETRPTENLTLRTAGSSNRCHTVGADPQFWRSECWPHALHRLRRV